MIPPKGNSSLLEKQARYLHSVACLVKYTEKHDELQRKAQELLAKAAHLRRKGKWKMPTMANTAWTLASYPCTAKRLMLDGAGVVSLLGLMKILRVGEVATMLDGLRVLVDVQVRKRASVGGDARLDREDMVHVGELSQQGRELFSSIEFDDAARRFALFEAGILSDSTVARMQSEVENLIAAIIGELQKRAFFFISLDRNNMLTQYPFGEDVAKAFPSTRNDIGQAAVCLAMELHLASVFHLMRVAEGGLRCLAQDRRIVFPADVKLQAWEEVFAGTGEVGGKNTALSEDPKT